MNMETCEHCKIGRYRPARLPFISWLNKDILVMPNAPGQVCDVCGDSFFDPEFLFQLDSLINSDEDQETGQSAPTWSSRRHWQQV